MIDFLGNLAVVAQEDVIVEECDWVIEGHLPDLKQSLFAPRVEQSKIHIPLDMSSNLLSREYYDTASRFGRIFLEDWHCCMQKTHFQQVIQNCQQGHAIHQSHIQSCTKL